MNKVSALNRCLNNLFLTALLGFGVTHVNAAETPSVEDFTRYAEFESVRISPDGSKLLVAQRQDDVERLLVLDSKTYALQFSTRFDKNLSIANMQWAHDEFLLVQPGTRVPAIQDYHVPTGEIIGVDLKREKIKFLFGYRSGKTQTGTNLKQPKGEKAAGRVLDVLPDDDKNILVQSQVYGIDGGYNEVFKLNLSSLRRLRLARAPVRRGSFVVGNDHLFNVVSGIDGDGNSVVYARENDKKDWRQVFTSSLREGSLSPILWMEGSDSYLTQDRVDGDKRGLVLWNPYTDAREEVFRHEQVDYRWTVIDEADRLWAVHYEDHFPSYHYPDESHPLAVAHKKLSDMFPDAHVRIINTSRDEKTAVVYVSGPKYPGTYLILDIPSFKFTGRLDAKKWLNEAQLADMFPIEFKARDGLLIRGYLTLPPGKESDLPLVVLVHGGPHGVADRWGWNSEAQLLAARGYAVLQINYRGSGGRGQKFQAAGYGRWGAEMQDDIADGVKFVIEQGTANPDKVCIYGASYGGYAAITGAYTSPDLYQCAIGYAGVYDLPMMFKRGDIRQSTWGKDYLEMAVGDDEAELRARSPVHNAQKIKAKVLLIHGERDIRVPIEHAQAMRKALRSAGNEPGWLVEKQEGHGFFNEENRKNMYIEVLNFLDQNIGPSS